VPVRITEAKLSSDRPRVISVRTDGGEFNWDSPSFVDAFEFPGDAERLGELCVAAGIPASVVSDLTATALRQLDDVVLPGRRLIVVVSPQGEALSYLPVDALAEEEEPPSAFEFEFGPDLARPRPPPVWLCKRFGMLRGRPIIISGFAGSIKTWLAMLLALNVADGRDQWLPNLRIQLAGAVRLFDFENLGDVSARRLQRLAHGADIDLGQLGEKFGRVALPRTHLTSGNAEAELIKASQGIALGIIDSLRAACPGVDENSSQIREYLDMLQRVTAVTGVIWIVLHHEGKANEGRPGVQRMRGSSALADAIDASLRLEEVDQGKDTYAIQAGKHSATRGQGDGPLNVLIKDVGDVDPVTGYSRGIRIVPVDLAVTPADKVQRIADAMTAIIRRKGPMGSRDLRAQVKGSSDNKLAALKLLRKTADGLYGLPDDHDLNPQVPKKSRKRRPSGGSADPHTKSGVREPKSPDLPDAGK
jgi:hypothetical protein